MANVEGKGPARHRRSALFSQRRRVDKPAEPRRFGWQPGLLIFIFFFVMFALECAICRTVYGFFELFEHGHRQATLIFFFIFEGWQNVSFDDIVSSKGSQNITSEGMFWRGVGASLD